MDRRRGNDDKYDDSPTYSRLFVVCDRRLNDKQLKEAFDTYGFVEDIHMPRDHNTGEVKGIAYIKYSKTSEAAKALEAMNRRTIPQSSRPLKVMVATNRSDIHNDDDDADKYKRLFLNTAKLETEDNIRDHFKQFGQVESVVVQRNRDTGESKCGAYVKYRKFSEAAMAIENSDPKYRAIFAQPKGFNKRRHETSFESNINHLTSAASMRSSIISVMNTQPKGFTSINFMCSPYLNQHHVERIFDLVPGMTNCTYFVDLLRNFGKGTVAYSNPVSASYAVEKLNKFEYPPGSKIFVKPNDVSKFGIQDQNYSSIPEAVNKLKNAISATTNSDTPDLAKLAEAIAEASKLIKTTTAGVSNDIVPDSNDLNYCSAKLPPPQPLANIDSVVAKRCFLVCKPHPPALTVLRDIFCRFGDLINVYTLPNKTVGYARYASVKAADDAIANLHGAEICGVRIKVLEAEDEAPPKRRRD